MTKKSDHALSVFFVPMEAFSIERGQSIIDADNKW